MPSSVMAATAVVALNRHTICHAYSIAYLPSSVPVCVLQYGCLVVNAPTANTVAAAEHGIATMCALARNVAQADASMKAGKWERSKFVGVSLVDKTLAIMGFGKVGSSCCWTHKGGRSRQTSRLASCGGGGGRRCTCQANKTSLLMHIHTA